VSRHLPVLPLFVALLSWPAVATASPTFPAQIQSHLDMPCTPPCTLCHRDEHGGFGTVIQRFGLAMQGLQDVGIKGKHPELIGPALDALEQNGTDSDGDDRPDVEELREGSNPNQAGDGVLCATYGCAASRAKTSPLGAAPNLVLLLTFSTILRRRRRHLKNADRTVP